MKKQWWHDKVAYQIYPKSFYDTNGDGIGDLRGVIRKLDYLKELGIDIIWLSPIYQSPFVDQGYDISDYYQISELFGTMEDFDTLLAEAKKRDMYIVMDLVINHCSDKHEWFQKALKDPEGEYGDYFFFRKGKDGNPPSNYRSYFGGNAWEKVPDSDYYYFHMFAKEQPDFNWNNPKLLEELYAMINWWLEKGVAGFRIDAIINIKKDPDFTNLPPDGPDGLASVWRMVEKVNGVGDLLEALKKNTFEKYHAFTVAEVFNMKKDELIEFVGENGHFSTMFDFSAHSLTMGEHGWYDSKPVQFEDFRRVLFHSQRECMDVGFLANIIENHDEPRGASRFLPDYAQNPAGIKMLGTVSVLLRGIPFLYQGQEIGMQNCPMDSIEDYDDISTRGEYRMALEAGLTPEEALQICCVNSRDNARTPMQWDDSENAGFSSSQPWLKVNPNYKTINVKAQLADNASVLSYYKKLLALRKSEPYREVFTYGSFAPLFENEPFIFAYERKTEEQTIAVLANFGQEERTLTLENASISRLLLNNQKELSLEGDQLTLKSCQVVVMERMDMEKRMLAGLPYKTTNELFSKQAVTKKKIARFNHLDPADLKAITASLKDILGKTGENVFINAPFHCDYGSNIEVGENFFANYNFTVLDTGKVTIGKNAQIAPNVSIYTAGHPVHPDARNSGYEYGVPVSIGDNVWIGGNTVILPGVTIGDNVVIGAGSVVTKNLPDNVIAAGNPCRIIRKITDEDKDYYYKDQKFDVKDYLGEGYSWL